jgi:hypothetical protein
VSVTIPHSAPVNPYLVPVLLDATFGSAWKCLSRQSQSRPGADTVADVGSLTFAISAQLFPASLMFFNLCSSAGVHGVFVRLFLGGGSMGADAKLGSPMPAEDEAAPGADMTRGGAPGARLLFRAAACGDDSGGLTGLFSPTPGCAKKGGIPDGNSSSCLSTRLDIGYDVKTGWAGEAEGGGDMKEQCFWCARREQTKRGWVGQRRRRGGDEAWGKVQSTYDLSWSSRCRCR